MKVIETDDAPGAIGPYNQAKAGGGLVFTAGQGAITPEGEILSEASVKEQTEQTLSNIGSILEAAGCQLEDVLKTTVYLVNIDDYEEMNEAYAGFFPRNAPARSAVEVEDLPVDLAVEIEAVAVWD